MKRYRKLVLVVHLIVLVFTSSVIMSMWDDASVVEPGTEYKVLYAVQSFGAIGCTSKDLLSKLSASRDSPAGENILQLVNRFSAKQTVSDLPVRRIFSKGNVRYYWKAMLSTTESKCCWLCNDKIEFWEVLGGGDEDFTRLFRLAIVSVMCEKCFRVNVCNNSRNAMSVGYAVLPVDFFSSPAPLQRHTNGSINLPMRDTKETKDLILAATIHEVCILGIRGGNSNDISDKVRVALSPTVLNNLNEIVEWCLHETSSKSVKSSKPLLRRAIVGFNGTVDVLFVSKEFIDPLIGCTNGGISLEIEDEAIAGSLFGLRSFTTFRVYVQDIVLGTEPALATITQIEVLRRYSDFQWLRKELVRYHHDEAVIPPLPKKQFLGRFQESFLEIRMHGLEHFLSIVATHPVLHKAFALQTFFQQGPFDHLKEEYCKLPDKNIPYKIPSLDSFQLAGPLGYDGVSGQLYSNHIETLLSSEYQRNVRKCYKSIDKLNSASIKAAELHEKRSSTTKSLATEESMLGVELNDNESLIRFLPPDSLTEVPLSEAVMSIRESACATTELLSTLSQLDTIQGTSNRAFCIRMHSVRLQLKEWHRNLKDSTSWFENRSDTICLLKQNCKSQSEMLRAQAVIDQTKRDVAQEATWLESQHVKELHNTMLGFVQLQISHAKQKSKIWQEFLPTFLNSLPNSNHFEKPCAAVVPNSIWHVDFNKTYCDSDDSDDIGSEDCFIDIRDIAFGERIGRGTFGAVFKGVYHGQQVAVKSIEVDPSQNARVRSMCLKEAQVMRGLPPHPNIVAFFGVCLTPKNVFLVMELVESGSLLDLLLMQSSDTNITVRKARNVQSNRPRASFEDTKKWQLTLALGAAKGIHVLHSSKPVILHRDIKTSNLLVSLPKLTVKVCDFGLARFKLENESVKSFVGTASWVAPEVIVSRKGGYTTKADVYSFGIVLWQIYARVHPYPNLHTTQVMFQVAHDGLRPAIPSAAPPRIQKLIESCWHQNPDKRPEFAAICKVLGDMLH